MSPAYSRRLSPLERLSLVANDCYHYNADGVVEGLGFIDRTVLQAAVDSVAQANPGLRVRLRGRLGLRRWVDSGIAPQVRVLPKADWDGNSEVGASFMKVQLDALKGGPVAELLVVPCSDGRTRYVFRGLHAAIDGRSAMHWVQEVFRVLRGEAPVGTPTTLTDFDIQAQYNDRAAPETVEPVRAITVVAAGKTDGEPLHFIWRRIKINRSIGQILPKTAIFLAEYARRREPGAVEFVVPIDYRGLRTQEMGVSNLTGHLRLPVPEGATARSLMRALATLINSFADCRSMPGGKLVRWIPMGFLRRQIGAKYDFLHYEPNKIFQTAGLVSMGMSQPDAYSCPGFEAESVIGVPPAIGKLNIIFMNHRDSVVVCLSTPARYNDRGQFDEMVTAYQRHFSREGQIA
jgi:hypothetical protein